MTRFAALLALLLAATFGGCSGSSSTARDPHPRPEAELMADLGELHPSAKSVLANEDVPIGPAQGLQSRKDGLFEHVKFGKRPDKATKYLWTIDDRGVNCALESTPFQTARGHITHTNISRLARFAGEAWFTGRREVTVNGHSGRFGDRAQGTPVQYEAAVELWERLGYRVTVIPLGER
jgi:hypothetical protein